MNTSERRLCLAARVMICEQLSATKFIGVAERQLENRKY